MYQSAGAVFKMNRWGFSDKVKREGNSYLIAGINALVATVWGFYGLSTLWGAPEEAKVMVEHRAGMPWHEETTMVQSMGYPFAAVTAFACFSIHPINPREPSLASSVPDHLDSPPPSRRHPWPAFAPHRGPSSAVGSVRPLSRGSQLPGAGGRGHRGTPLPLSHPGLGEVEARKPAKAAALLSRSRLPPQPLAQARTARRFLS